jgi:hypothetical protein
MVSKELRKLNRRELIDIIYQMKKNEQQMQEQIAALQAELEEKRFRLSQAGSIAEAALAVTNVFSAAQEAADVYLRQIASMKEETEIECKKIQEQAQKDAPAPHPEENSREAVAKPPRQTGKLYLPKVGQLIRRWKNKNVKQ